MNPPTVIQRYRILKQIGQGGMGALYLAADPALDRLIAIKVLREDNDELRQRFAREAQSAARLSHVNIVTIYDVGEYEGQPFIAMEYVEGTTLADVITRGALIPLRQNLDWLYEICDGLEHAHRAKIIHRDIKPANIMIAASGRAKILDFGIARPAESSLTQAGILVGTINYMSPEQVMGQAVDARSDIFAVGLVAYELFSYRQAFSGGLDSGVLHRILSTDPTPLDQVVPGLDPELVRIVTRAIAKSPDQRYPDLAIMRRDVDRLRQRISAVESADATIGGRSDETIAFDTPAPKAERRTRGREDLLRRRETELATQFKAARAALDEGRWEDAVNACERVLIVDENNAQALDLFDRARAGLDAEQLARFLDGARGALDTGALTEAAVLVDQATLIAPDSADAAQMADRIAQRREQRAAIADAIAQAVQALGEGSPEHAIAAANLALTLDPDNPDARAVLQEAEAAAAAAREPRELEQRASAAVASARALFSRGEFDEALTLLQALTPPHLIVTEALRTMRDEAREIKRRRREEDARRAAAGAASTGRAPAQTADKTIILRSLQPGPTAAQRPFPVKIVGAAGVAAVLLVGLIVAFRGGSMPEETSTSITTSIASTTSTSTLAGGTSTAVVTSSSAIPTTTTSIAVAASMNTLVIDALPWAQIVAIRDASNQPVAVKRGSYTPLVLTVPAGTYTVTLRSPDGGETRTVPNVAVEALRGGRAFAEFRKVDADAYFNKALVK